MRFPRLKLLSIAVAAALTLSLSSSLASGEDTAGKVFKLSNETTLSRYANSNDKGPVRADHDSHARVVGHLRLDTEDGYPEVYLVLNGYTDPKTGDTWYQIRLPQRPNGKTGWVSEEDLGPLQTVTTQLIVDRTRLRATLYRKGRKIFQAPVGVGKKSTPTPGGKFWIREKLVLRGGHGVYGPLAFGTAAYSDKLTDWPKGGVVGIHGTNQPSLVPGRPSHGCIRMHNNDILKLGRIMPIGTPLLIK
jgi:lipoprotein-anchoring transpeptidase ErfK/SrfK